MHKYSSRSMGRLLECDRRLQKVFTKVIEITDNSILEGHRNEDVQNKAFDEGRSKLKFPLGKHNSMPSMAIDAAPYPIDWEDTKRFYLFAGIVIAVGHMMGITIRWGGDWDRDMDVNDQKFMDLVHFEIVTNV